MPDTNGTNAPEPTKMKESASAKADAKASAPSVQTAKTPADKTSSPKKNEVSNAGAGKQASASEKKPAAATKTPADTKPAAQKAVHKSGAADSKKDANKSSKASAKPASKVAATAKTKQSKKAASDVKSSVPGVRATAKYVRVAPRKARLVIDLIRNKPVEQATQILQFSQRAVAVDVEKVLRSACANAFQNKGLRTEDLVVTQAYVDEGPMLKRIRPRAKGSASRINKRTSHITVVVAPRKEA